MRTLVITRDMFRRIKELVYRADGDISVRLFGSVAGDYFFVQDVLDTETEAHPNLQWFGELYVHSDGCPVLFPEEKEAVQRLLQRPDAPQHHNEFIAGAILKRDNGVMVCPLLFSRDNPGGEIVLIEIPELDWGKVM